MEFILTGFTPDTRFRVFAFQGIAADRTRTDFKVRADLGLIHTYGIRIQELPLLCRRLLERREEGGQDLTLTFTEEEMQLHAANCAAERAAIQKRKSTYKPPTNANASGWRAPQRPVGSTT